MHFRQSHINRFFPRMFTALIAAAALSLQAGSAAAPAAPSQVAADTPPVPTRYSWIGKIAPGKTLRVVNPFGDIRARFGGFEGKIEVTAVLQHLSNSAPPLQVTHDESAGALTLTVGYPVRPAAGGAPAPPAADPRDRADLVIFVPRGTPLAAETVAGAIEAKGLQSDVTARSVKGEISARVSGRVEALSERGGITVFLDPGEREPQRLETLTGDITVYLRDNAALDVTAATSGEISTDFSLVMERDPHQEPDKRARVKVGKGGAPLALASKRGRIRLLWLPALPAGSMMDND